MAHVVSKDVVLKGVVRSRTSAVVVDSAVARYMVVADSTVVDVANLIAAMR
jgi:hypothetical protein